MKLQQTLFNVFMLLLLTASSVSAQTTVTVGTTVLSSGVGEPSPVNALYDNLRYQAVYTAAELSSAGLSANATIEALGWDVTQAPLYALKNYTIRMGHTTNANSSTHIATGLTQVYNTASYTPTAGGFDMLTFSTPFTWNGTDNIVIDVCFGTNAGWSPTGTLNLYNIVANQCRNIFDFTTSMCSNSTTSANSGKPVVRFSIAAPLPVELIYFQGKANDNQIQLNWETASELNNSGFEIHKSNNGKDWETIDFVVGQGTTLEVSTYQYEDQKPLIGTNYYRLKQVDFDGAFEYSKVIAIEYNIEESNITIFPNPSNGIVNLQINNPSNQKMQIKILDNLGRIIRDSEIIEGEANWQQEMVIKEKGIYTVAIQIGNEIIYKRIVIAD